MIDIKLLRENPEKVKKSCHNKQANIDIDKILELDKKRRGLITEIENSRAEQKKISKQGAMSDEQIEKAKKLKIKIKEFEPQLEIADKEFNELFIKIPNLPLDDVPIGKDETENKIIKEVGKKPKIVQPKNYLELAEKLGIIDVESAAKTSGSRFGFIKGGAALLEIGLIQLAFETLAKEGFIPIIPPTMLKPEMMKAMGYVERGGDEIYFLEKDNLYLVGTSEQMIGPMHSGDVFEAKDLSKRYIAFSSCFRREAGSYGKDTKGILRVHQFDKVEMFSFTRPEDSQKEHNFLLSM
jgi:seryl-tRNA synthetase